MFFFFFYFVLICFTQSLLFLFNSLLLVFVAYLYLWALIVICWILYRYIHLFATRLPNGNRNDCRRTRISILAQNQNIWWKSFVEILISGCGVRFILFVGKTQVMKNHLVELKHSSGDQQCCYMDCERKTAMFTTICLVSGDGGKTCALHLKTSLLTSRASNFIIRANGDVQT